MMACDNRQEPANNPGWGMTECCPKPARGPGTSPILEVRDLRTPILKPTSFALERGECIAVRGPSGAGKTLLLRAIADLDVSEGFAALAGCDRTAIPGPEWRRLVGLVPAQPAWWAETVGEHFPASAEAPALCRQLGFAEEVREWRVGRLSTGERLRLALLRALVVQPHVLLLDEPTAALDAASMAAVEAVIAARRQMGLAVIWVTHDTAQAKRIARRQLIVEAGRVREEVEPWPATSP